MVVCELEAFIYITCLDQGLAYSKHYKNVINHYYKNLEAAALCRINGYVPSIRHTVKWRELNRDFLTKESMHMQNIEFQYPQ